VLPPMPATWLGRQRRGPHDNPHPAAPRPRHTGRPLPCRVEDLTMKIAPGIHRIGDNSMINAYLVEQAGEVTNIHRGGAGFYKDIDGELAAMGRTPADVRALILTHGHTDHIGFAERLRRERRVPVLVHEADAALARGEVPNPSKGYGPVKLGPLLGFLWF